MSLCLTEELVRQATKICESHRERLEAPALSIKIFNSNQEELLHLKSSDETLRGRSLLHTHRFPIGSLTKSFVAAAILILRDANALSLQDSPLRHIPELRQHQKFAWNDRTIFDLLTMQSGLTADYQGSWAEQAMAATPDELKLLLSREPHSSQVPHGRYEYSNLSYILLGRVISEVSGLTAREFIEKRIIEPLGLTETNWCAEGIEVATGFELHGTEWREEVQVLSRCDAAALGGLVSSHNDLSKWITFITGKIDRNHQVLRVSSRQELTAPKIGRQIERNYAGIYRPSTYGYGLVQVAVDNEWAIGHGGAVPGFGTFFLWVPRANVSIVAVANRRYVPVNDPCFEIAELILKHAQASRAECPLIIQRGRELLELSRDWKKEKADEIFERSIWQDIQEKELSELLLHLRDITDEAAIEVKDSVSGVIRITGKGELSYFLNPLEPGLIQSIEYTDICSEQR